MTIGPAIDAARAALALALGHSVESPKRVDWRRAHVVARIERLTALAWLRAGDQIREHAPPDVVARWRAESVAADELASRQREVLREMAQAAERDGEILFVLKGLPLADSLYGDVSVRVCCDIDLLVDESRRASVHNRLTTLGWEQWYGVAPYDAGYRRTGREGTLFLEVHSILASEALAHCPLTPEAERRWSRDGLTLRVLDGPVAVVYLAVNLAKHGTPSLMSYVDLATVWNGLTAGEKASAHRLAERSRLARCLQWALEGAAALPGAAAGAPAAFRRLGYHSDRRTSTHALLRLMWLADRPSDAARILATWTWPRSLRNSGDALAPFWGRRLRRSFAGRFRYTRAYAADATPQS